jgi:hypothetical protein
MLQLPAHDVEGLGLRSVHLGTSVEASVTVRANWSSVSS